MTELPTIDDIRKVILSAKGLDTDPIDYLSEWLIRSDIAVEDIEGLLDDPMMEEMRAWREGKRRVVF